MRSALTVAVLVALCACASSRKERPYRDKNMDFGSISTVAVMPFANLTREGLAAERVRDVLSTSLLATGSIYVLPSGEVARGIAQVGIAAAATPTPDQVMALGKAIKADAIVTGVVKEYGEVRSGTTGSNVVSFSVQLFEAATGKVVWSGSTTQGGIGFKDRLFGSGGAPLNDVTKAAVDDIINQLFE